MGQQIVTVRNSGGEPVRFMLDVFQDGEHWTSTLARLDAAGQPDPAKVAPRFYGLTHEQARRRMLSVLENQYEEVQVSS